MRRIRVDLIYSLAIEQMNREREGGVVLER